MILTPFNILIFSLLFPVWVQAQEGYTVRFLEKMSERLLRKFDEKHLMRHEAVATTPIDSTDRVDQLFSEVLIRYLNRKYSVSNLSRNEAADYLMLRFNVLDWDVNLSFDKLSRKVIRRGSLVLFFELIDHPSSEIIWQGEFEETHSDSISVEEMNIMPVQSEESNRANILEPILITGVTGVVVYLFYALRSR